MLLEVQVHALLKAYLREHRDIDWPHHLTIARLVARGLRIGRSSLIQTGTEVERYSLSYLIPALLTTENILLVVPEAWQVKLSEQDIPNLQNWFKKHQSEVELSTSKLMITSFPNWLSDRLNHLGHFPDSLPTVIIQAEDLETWSRKQLTLNLTPQDWLEQLQQANSQQHKITTVKVKITQNLYQHPSNPYGCYALDESIQIELESLWSNLDSLGLLSPVMEGFWRQWQQGEQIFWASLQRETGQFQLFLAPHAVAGYLSQIWTRQPVVIMGQFIDKQITTTLGLEDILQLNFAPDAQRELIQLYSPARFPFPNTPEFQPALYQEINKLITNQGLVILVDDLPLKGQLASILASEYGSRVQVETQDLPTDSILISGWEFWCEQSEQFWSPELLIMVTLPLPSLEHPVVASRVSYYKQKRQDWFRDYLLPTALNKMQKAIVPLRNSQGTLVILDNRVNYRSYGDDIIKALEPCARINNLS